MCPALKILLHATKYQIKKHVFFLKRRKDVIWSSLSIQICSALRVSQNFLDPRRLRVCVHELGSELNYNNRDKYQADSHNLKMVLYTHTTLPMQSMMNAKVSQQRFWPRHLNMNSFIKDCNTPKPMMCVTFKSGSLCYKTG